MRTLMVGNEALEIITMIKCSLQKKNNEYQINTASMHCSVKQIQIYIGMKKSENKLCPKQ